MIDKMKKHWFVVIIAIIFLVGIIYFTAEQVNSTLKGKRVDGKDVVYEINKKDVLADDYYDKLMEAYGDAEVYKLFERSILSSIETSDEIAKNAKSQAEMIKKNVSAQNGAAGLDQLEDALISMGYKGLDDLEVLYQDMAKREVIVGDYLTKHYDEYVKGYEEAYKPRMVSHILIRMENPEEPTEEQQAKIDKVDQALKDGKAFGEVAMELSDDEQTAPEKGSLGYMDANTEYEPTFLKAAMETESKKTSEWINTPYGRHMIHVDSTDFEDFKSDSQFIMNLTNTQPKALYNAIWEKSSDLDIEFFDKDIETNLKKVMGIEGGN